MFYLCRQKHEPMKQRLPIVVLFALIVASSLFSLNSYRTTEVMVTEEMNQALAKALEEQQSEVISADTIRVFNNYLQTEDLKGKAVLALDTEKGFQPRPQVSTATILALSDQRPSMVLWSMVVLWGMYCLYQHRRRMAMGMFGGLALQEGNFVDAKGCVVRLTPMQQQLMEMLWQSPSHKLSKTERCALAQERGCQRDALYACPQIKTNHRGAFQPEN